MLLIRNFGYTIVAVSPEINDFLTTFADRAGAVVQIPQLLQCMRLPIRRHQSALAGHKCSTECTQIEIAIVVQVNQVLAVGKGRGQRQNFGDELIDPNGPIAAKSDNLFRVSVCQSTQTECSSM